MALQYSILYMGLFGFLIFVIVTFIIVVAIIGIIITISRRICEQPEKLPRISHIHRRQSSVKRAAPRTVLRTEPMEIQLTMCTECEATILAETSVCPHCGNPRPICMVCHLPIQFTDSVLLCPHCKGQAHRIHLLEYLKVKGTCPICQTDLDEHELITKTNLNSSKE